MESRKITVVSTKNQKKSVIMSNATTLSELKQDFDSNGIDYSDMTFYEGLSKTELKSNESILPHDLLFKGNVTNELVIMLTNPNKKIRSGACYTKREEAKNFFKNNHEMALKFKREHSGKNWTNVNTEELLKFINNNASTDETNNKSSNIIESSSDIDSIKDALFCIVDALCSRNLISNYELETITKILGANKENKNELVSSYSEDDINSMFSDIEI